MHTNYCKRMLPAMALVFSLGACAPVDLNNPLLGEAGLILGIVLNPRYEFTGTIKDSGGVAFGSAQVSFTVNPFTSAVTNLTTVNSATTDSAGRFTVKLPVGSFKGTVIQSNGFATSFNLSVEKGGATSGSGVSVIYTADVASTYPTITAFTPLAGAAGDVVTITGTGFSTTSDGNSVYINGVQTTVLAANATSISVPVPTGAATWRVAVNNGVGLAVSNQIFNVVSAGFTDPIISDFTPYQAKAGAIVTIVGKNFDLTYTNNTVGFSGVDRTAMSATGSTVDVMVPINAIDGKLVVRVGGKSAISTNSFTLLPGGNDPTLPACTVNDIAGSTVGLCNVQP